jgi:hypothetical protein
MVCGVRARDDDEIGFSALLYKSLEWTTSKKISRRREQQHNFIKTSSALSDA